DITAPIITCPGNTTINCQDNNTPTAPSTATATDNCTTSTNITIGKSDASTQNADAANVGHYNYTITRTWTATDPSGNSSTCAQTISVRDVTAPLITCPASTTVNCQDNTAPTATGYATATDNCAASTNMAITSSDGSTQDANVNSPAHYNYAIT